MELRRKDVARQDRRGKGLSVIGARGDDRGICRPGKKTVNEIDIDAAFDATKERTIRLDDFEPVPADLRDFQSALLRKPHHLALKNGHSRCAAVELLALLKHGLIAPANPQQRAA